MTKKDLRDGMIIETRKFGAYLVMGNCTIARALDGWIELDDQNDDLTYSDDDFTIDKVYANDVHNGTLKGMFKHPGKLLWERTSVKEMTLEAIEKELGYKVKLIDTKPNREFKVGDKVRTTKLKDTYGTELFPIGTVCTIAYIHKDGGRLPYRLEKEDGDYYYYNADMFEPCEREFKVGDVVRIRRWADMAEEFGLDSDGDIDCKYHFTTPMTNLCGRKCTISTIEGTTVKLDFGDDIADNTWWLYSTDMIEHI